MDSAWEDFRDNYPTNLVTDDHHLGLGGQRGLAHHVFVYGWRIALAHHYAGMIL